MNKWIFFLFFLLSLSLTAGIIFWIIRQSRPNLMTSPLSQPTTSIQDIQILGSIPYWDQARATESFRQNISLFNYISVFWYHLNESGNIATYDTAAEDPTLIDLAHQNNVKVLALIANLPDYQEGGDWDADRVEKAISNSSSRKNHIQELLSLVNKRNFDGLNIDYEELRKDQKDDFSHFIEELAQALHQEGKILNVAIHPKTSSNDPSASQGASAQDWKKISQFADQLYLMTYGQHYIDSDPGPIASPNWMTKPLEYAYDTGVDPKKILLGIPLYAEEWEKKGNHDYQGIDSDLTYQEVAALINQQQLSTEIESDSLTPFVKYEKNGKQREIWFENANSFQAKTKLLQKYPVGGLAFWRLGGEDPEIWKILRQLKQQNF